MAKKVVLAGACRTAIGKMGGALSNTPAADLGAIVIKEALNRAGVKPEMVDEVKMGCVIQAAQGQNVARQAIQFQPRCNAADRPSERFEVHILRPVGMEHRRHVLLQRPRRQVFQHRISDFQHCLQPIRSCFHLIRLPCRIRRLPIRSVRGMPTGRRSSASAPAASSAPCVFPAG